MEHTTTLFNMDTSTWKLFHVKTEREEAEKFAMNLRQHGYEVVIVEVRGKFEVRGRISGREREW